MAIEMKKTKIKITKAIYIDMSISDISKTLIYKTEQNYAIQIMIALLFIL